MSPRSTTPASPVCMDELLVLLRRARLLDEGQWRRLAAGWPVDLSAAEAARRLVEAGLLTAFQSEQILAGRAHRLRFGPYRLLARLGGGRCRVYKAEHVLMKRLVTLKVLGRSRPRRSARAQSATGGLRDEVAIVGGLSHPNLVSALHAARLRGRLVLVLEYVQGVDLEEFVEQTGPLPMELACEVLRQAAQALAYLHGQGLVHRDVKPANLILSHTSPDSRPIVKLIDFGLACRAGAAHDELCGTLDYMAPECGRGERVDVRSDLYSLGCTLYRLLTGQVPHPGGNWTSKLLRHQIESPASLTALRPDVPPAVARVIARLMAREPEARFADPRSLLDALDRLPPVPVARPVRRPVRPAKRLPQRRRLLVPGFLLAAVLVGAAVGVLTRLSWSTPLPDSPPAPSTLAAFITVSGQKDIFTDLEKAIRAAPAEATLILHGRGPHSLRPVAWRGKSLTLRAAQKERPRIARLDVPGAKEEALLSVDGGLTLEGLELWDGSSADRVAPMLTVSRGGLIVRDCRIEARTTGSLVALRRGLSLRLERCTIEGRGQGLAVELAAGKGVEVHLIDTHLRVRDVMGSAVLVWAAEPVTSSPAAVVLRRCRVEAGQVLTCRALGGKVDVRAEDCRFVFQQALLSLDACRWEPQWQRRLTWRERGNEYITQGAWVRLEGRAAVWDELAWRRLWPPGPPSRVGE